MEVMDGVLLQLSMRAIANLTLSTLAIRLLRIAGVTHAAESQEWW
jgi:hypothetical protein